METDGTKEKDEEKEEDEKDKSEQETKVHICICTNTVILCDLNACFKKCLSDSILKISFC